MIKNKFTLLTAATLTSLLMFSCASSKNVASVETDAYDSEETSIVTPKAEKTETTSKQANAPYNQKKKATIADNIKDFFTFGNKNDFIKNDQSTVFSTTVTGSIKQQTSTIYISTKEDLVGFGSTYMAAYYIVLMDETSRAKLAAAYKAYLSDFDNKRLDRKNSKSFKQYGTFKTTLNWGSIESSTPNHGSGTAYLGYEFKKNSPYFVISNYPYTNDYYEVAQDSTTRESMSIKYYFTKAQMKELLNFISEDAINQAFIEYNGGNKFEDEYIESDEYISADSDETTEVEE